MKKLMGFMFFVTIILGAGLGAAWCSKGNQPAKVSLSPEQLMVKEVILRGETILAEMEIENSSSDNIRILDAQTSCGCADVNIAGNFDSEISDGVRLVGTLLPGVSTVTMSIDTTGKSKGGHDFEYAFLAEDRQENVFGVKGFVTLTVAQGIKTVPNFVVVNESKQKIEIGVYSDTPKIASVGDIRVSHPQVMQVNQLAVGEGQLKHFDLIQRYEIVLDFEEFLKISDEFCWVDFIGKGSVDNTSRVVLKTNQVQSANLVVSPASGMTILSNKKSNSTEAKFLVNSLVGEPTIDGDSKIGVLVNKIDETTYSVSLTIPNGFVGLKNQVSIAAGEDTIKYSIRLLK